MYFKNQLINNLDLIPMTSYNFYNFPNHVANADNFMIAEK